MHFFAVQPGDELIFESFDASGNNDRWQFRVYEGDSIVS